MTDNKKCILIIEDTPMFLMEMVRMLSSKYAVKIAKSGEDGIKITDENNIDLILLDLFLPGISGFEVLTHLKESNKHSHIPVIIISGSGSDEDTTKGITLGAADYIVKPFDGNTLLQYIGKFLE